MEKQLAPSDNLNKGQVSKVNANSTAQHCGDDIGNCPSLRRIGGEDIPVTVPYHVLSCNILSSCEYVYM